MVGAAAEVAECYQAPWQLGAVREAVEDASVDANAGAKAGVRVDGSVDADAGVRAGAGAGADPTSDLMIGRLWVVGRIGWNWPAIERVLSVVAKLA
jgi:hypothetical protein